MFCRDVLLFGEVCGQIEQPSPSVAFDPFPAAHSGGAIRPPFLKHLGLGDLCFPCNTGSMSKPSQTMPGGIATPAAEASVGKTSNEVGNSSHVGPHECYGPAGQQNGGLCVCESRELLSLY